MKLVLRHPDDFGDIRCLACCCRMYPVPGWWAWTCLGCGWMSVFTLEKER